MTSVHNMSNNLPKNHTNKKDILKKKKRKKGLRDLAAHVNTYKKKRVN